MNGDPLLTMRNKVARFSLVKASTRISRSKTLEAHYDEIELESRFEDALANDLGFSNICTEFGDTSSVTKARFDPSGEFCCVVGASGQGKVWNTSNCESPEFCTEVTQLLGNQKLCDVDCHPNMGQIPGSAPNLITGTTTGQVLLWTFDTSCQQQKSLALQAHQDRTNATRYHPSGYLFLSASYDKSWSLWDANTAKLLSNQKGHLAEIHDLSTHPDGSLIFTGSLDGYGMVWDIRTGKAIYQLQTDNSILCSSFHPNGFELAVAGKSNLINVFDLRRKKQVKTIPAHCKLISDLEYNLTGTVLFSGSHDCHVKLWNARHYTMIDQDLEHPAKITSISVHGTALAVTMIDKKWTIWSNAKQSHPKAENSEREPRETVMHD